MNRKPPYLFFSAVILMLTASIWWELLRFYIRMVFAGSLLLSFIFIGIYFSRIYRTKHFPLMIVAVTLFIMPGLELSGYSLGLLIHSAPAQLILPFVAVGLLAYVLVKGDIKLLRIVLIVAGIFVLYTAFKTMRAEVNASRTFFANAASMDALMQAKENIDEGLMGYAQIHSIPFVVVGLVCIIRRAQKIWFKVVSVILSFVCLYALIKSGYTTATMCTGLAIVLSCISAKKKAISVALVVIGCVGFYFVVRSGLLLAILEAIAPVLDQKSNLVAKINDFAAIQTSVAGSAYWNVRTELYRLSWNAFCLHPIFGAGAESGGGGHSYFLDLLAGRGIVYFAIYITYYYGLFRFIYRVLPQDVKWYYTSACICLTLLLAYKANGLIAQNHVMCLVLPLMLLIRKQDFYAASNLMRRQLRLPALPFYEWR